MLDAAIIILSYLIGSIPPAYIAGKAFRKIDIRKTGDGNVGAANAFREIGPLAGCLVLVFDVLKGSVTIITAQMLTSTLVVYLAGLAVLLGHIFPVFLKFKGGRGEATAAGILVVLLPQAMLILLAIAIVPFILTRNTMVLGAILFVPLGLTAWIFGAPISLITYSIGIPCVVGLTHFLSTRHLDAEVRWRSKYMR
jgi:glycerol-3-phosphate acyltransferase PlsY